MYQVGNIDGQLRKSGRRLQIETQRPIGQHRSQVTVTKSNSPSFHLSLGFLSNPLGFFEGSLRIRSNDVKLLRLNRAHVRTISLLKEKDFTSH